MMNRIAARDFMTDKLVTFTPDTNIMDAVATLVQHRISGAPVVDRHGYPVGLLTERDCLEVALHASYHGDMGGKVGDFMTSGVRTTDADASIVDLAQRFLDAPYKRYPVMDHNRLVGVISRRDILRALLSIR